MNYILFDGEYRDNLLPLTYTKPVADLRIGILTIREKWEKHLGYTTSTLTEEYLEKRYPMVEMAENIMINASFCPTESLIKIIRNLKKNEAIFKDEDVIAFYTTEKQEAVDFSTYKAIEFDEDIIQVKNTWDIFSKNENAIQEDFALITSGRTSQPIPRTVNVINPENIFIEEGAQLTFATLNATTGPIYIGKNALIMEGCLVRGSLALCENAVLKMGAKIYGATTVGPNCKIGGEVGNSVLFQNTNKGHEGYLGNSVLGEWCNLGANTNNSNLKNNYAEVKLWSYEQERFAKTELQFCGLIMGDHSKCSINTMFNTGTVVGVSANIFGSGFPRNFVPSFSWGGSAGFKTYNTNKAFEVATKVMERRAIEFTKLDQDILEEVFEQTQKYRRS